VMQKRTISLEQKNNFLDLIFLLSLGDQGL
jgi:hypothetical protein